MKKLKLVAAIVAAASFGVPGLAAAQMMGGSGSMMGGSFHAPMVRGSGMGSTGALDPSGMMSVRLDSLKAALNLRPDQDAAWQTFAAAMQDQVQDMIADSAQMMQPAAGAAEWMTTRVRIMQDRADGMVVVSAAFNALYATFTPEQKAVADQYFSQVGMFGQRFGPFPG